MQPAVIILIDTGIQLRPFPRGTSPRQENVEFGTQIDLQANNLHQAIAESYKEMCRLGLS